jgi:hypothetical protein
MRILRSPLDLTLTGIALISVVAILLGHDNPFVRLLICAKLPCPHWSDSHAWEKIAYDLGVGSLISLFFYVLVVRIPERQKRLRFKRNFKQQYRRFKEDCIGEMLMIADGTYVGGFPEELTDQTKFREYFQEKVTRDQDRWDRFFNELEEDGLERIITHMEVFRDQTAFVLTSIDISDDEPFEFLQRLTSTIWQMKKSKADYDSKKSLLNFFWDVFAGFSIVSGYRDYDMIERAIDQI